VIEKRKKELISLNEKREMNYLKKRREQRFKQKGFGFFFLPTYSIFE